MSYYTYLASFLSVYRSNSLSLAAKELSISQPAVSRHIQALENRFGKALFNRHARGVIPTEAAHQLALSIGKPLDTLDNVLTKNSQSSGKSSAGLISIGGQSDQINKLLLPNVQPLIKQGYQFHIQIIFVDEHIPLLDNNELDFAISTSNRNPTNFDSFILLEEKYVLVGNEDWLNKINQAELDKGNLEALEQATWLIYNKEKFYIKEYFTSVFERDIPISFSIYVSNVLILLEAAIQGCGIAVLPYRLCNTYLESGILKQLHYPEVYPTKYVNLIWKEGKLRYPKYAIFHDYIIEKIDRMAV